MSGVITCTVKTAFEIMSHLEEDDLITLTLMDKKTHIHTAPKRIPKKNGEELIVLADSIEYQDNDFFGLISLHGVKNESLIQNLLFPQNE